MNDILNTNFKIGAKPECAFTYLVTSICYKT